MPEPHLRAADADRTAVATVLGQHMSAGRLTVDEYDERLTRAYAAKTYGELNELTADLPTTRQHVRAPQPSAQQPAQVCGPGWGGDAHSSWRSWLTTSLIVTTIWLATSLASWELNHFWPIWVIGPWGAVLLAQRIAGGSKRDGDPKPHQQLEN
jgi:Domain of unknown function (DUF1707)